MTGTFNKNEVRADARRCKVCGELLDQDAAFCGVCGTPVKQNPKPKRKRMRYFIMGFGVVLAVFLATGYFFKDKDDKRNSGNRITPTFSEESESDSHVETIESHTDAAETEKPEVDIEADIDAVHSRSCMVSGLLFYTDNMEVPVVILDVPISIYVNSTAGDQVYYEVVTQVSFGTCPIGKKKLKKYNNVEVDITGSLWAEDDIVYMDVQKIDGELPETEKKEETETQADDDYILSDSNSKVLTEADIAGLSLQEINYAKNEIYARHGRKFDSPELQRYFKSKDWYQPKIDPDDFSTSVFNRYEKKNVKFLAEKEESMQAGGYQLDK